MTSADLTTQTTTADYASVARDKATGNVLIALSPDAAGDLLDLLATVDAIDMVRNPDVHGLGTDDANALAAIARTLQDLLSQ